MTMHASDQKSKTEGWFEVIAGKSVQTEGGAKVFAFVNKYDTKPKRRLYEVLKSQGLQTPQPPEWRALLGCLRPAPD